ncbi:MAG TPA: FTR1 family protein [Thermoleophilaceae bacterium]|jgi:high-affinity iron transporter
MKGFGRKSWTVFGVAALGLLLYAALTAKGGVPDPSEEANLSHGAVVMNSGLLVLREGLEAILVLAAVTASFRGADSIRRRPVAAGAGVGIGVSVATWFLAAWVLGQLGGPGLDIQAATGLLAVAVLLVVMNWFFHRVYWTGWIQHHHRRRQRLLASTGAGVTAGLLLLGFTAVYREGFEIVLFLQNLRLKYGAGTVLEGVALGLAFTAAVGVLTFYAHKKLPYKQMLVLTGAMIGFVLVVMVGESAQELQLAGWLPTTNIGVTFPGWMGTWLAFFPTVETLAAQALAAGAVIGSYMVSEYMLVKRPKRAGYEPARRPEHEPALAPLPN